MSVRKNFLIEIQSLKWYNENTKREVRNLAEDVQLVFEQIRSRIQHIIKQNKANEVTHNTNICKSGVYILFVDCFEDDTIIPFYIGQTGNFQERHKQHFSEIMALNCIIMLFTFIKIMV